MLMGIAPFVKRKRVDIFVQIYFTTLAMPKEKALRVFKRDILHKIQ